MNTVSILKKLLYSNRGQLFLSGALLGICINVLHAVPFMSISEFFLIFAVIALFAITIPIITKVWNQKETQNKRKARILLKGMTAGSLVLAFIYLAELLITHSILFAYNPLQIKISRAPLTSMLTSLSIIILLMIADFQLKRKEIIKNNL